MLIREGTGWTGTYDILITHKDGTQERESLTNRLTNAALNLVRDGWRGTATDLSITRLALGTSDAPIDDADTQLGNEQFRTAWVSQLATGTGQAQSTALVLDTEAVMNIREIGIFATAAATDVANTGIMISRILWSRNKTNLESIQFVRTDAIGRG